MYEPTIPAPQTSASQECLLLYVGCARAIDNPSRSNVDVSPTAAYRKLIEAIDLFHRQSRPRAKAPDSKLVPSQIFAIATIFSLVRAVVQAFSPAPAEHLGTFSNHLRRSFGGQQADAIFLAAPDLQLEPTAISASLAPFLLAVTGLRDCKMASPFRDYATLAQSVAELSALTCFWVLPPDPATIRERTGLLRESCLCMLGGGRRNEVLQISPHCNLLASEAPRASISNDINPPAREFALPDMR